MSDQSSRPGVDWRGADLRGVNMAGVTLQYADLRATNLAGVNFTGSDLSYADLRGANVQGAVLSGAFLTFAIVIGEFTMASLLDRPAFGPYLQLIGANRAYEPSALAIISFAITWGCMGLIQVFARGAPGQTAGAPPPPGKP